MVDRGRGPVTVEDRIYANWKFQSQLQQRSAIDAVGRDPVHDRPELGADVRPVTLCHRVDKRFWKGLARDGCPEIDVGGVRRQGGRQAARPASPRALQRLPRDSQHRASLERWRGAGRSCADSG